MTQSEIWHLRGWHQEYELVGDDMSPFCHCGMPWPCLTLKAVEELDAATRVIAAVQTRRVVDAEYDQVGNRYVRGQIKYDALALAQHARKRARDIEDAALAEWEKVSQ